MATGLPLTGGRLGLTMNQRFTYDSHFHGNPVAFAFQQVNA